MTGPLQAAPPIAIGGKTMPCLFANGIVSGVVSWQGNHVAGDQMARAALSNGQLWIQKTTGWWQLYVQAGAYDIPTLGASLLSTESTITDLYGPVPAAFLKLVPGKSTSILIGALPTVMGAESTFTFQNMNVNRGLLWYQENAVNRGIQVNQGIGKFAVALSWNDGYYSNRYSWLSGSLTYASGPHVISFQGMGNLGHTVFQTAATPVQNNGSMYALIYTYSKGSWIAQPYVQLSDVPTDPKVGVNNGAWTRGAALLLSHSFRHGFSMAGRGEYISSTGRAGDGSVNLIYGPGSGAWSATITPTYQYGRFFLRADVAVVGAVRATPGSAYGISGDKRTQPRATIEGGFLF